MWLKSAVRQLAKWVPTSAEYIQERARAAATATGGGTAPLRIEADEVLDGEVVDEDTGEITAAEGAK
jgi:recombination protein RecT